MASRLEERIPFDDQAISALRYPWRDRTRPAAVERKRPRSLHFWAGGVLVASIVLAVLLAPQLASYPPDLVGAGERLQAPSLDHLFGTDAFGRDLFSRVLYGGRMTLSAAALAVLISAAPGIVSGLFAGYYRGWIDTILSRVMDIWLSLPGMLLALVLIARMGPSLEASVLALGITGIPAYFRMVRSGTLSLRSMAYVEAARAAGARGPRILFRHLLPNLSSQVLVLLTLRLGTVMLAIGGLSFIGLGAQPPDSEWGTLLAEGRDWIDTAFWLAFFPGLALTLTVAGLNLLGDGLRDVLAREGR